MAFLITLPHSTIPEKNITIFRLRSWLSSPPDLLISQQFNGKEESKTKENSITSCCLFNGRARSAAKLAIVVPPTAVVEGNFEFIHCFLINFESNVICEVCVSRYIQS
ncbi:hypothetical protein RD792_002950 [Penstemon davidsonii]|uniref:Uncharacterized protein n=1 Tax=Penstemon davidsonii TaxID=160366 RepID=A0ABR0DSE8_9LAMI|nr:hypothetical protein RD792_002950 [Penstemon davidsonii]